ncbi:MAG: TonB-dependent receptor [Thiobacillus sp.]
MEGNQILLTESGAQADLVTVPSAGLAPERVLSREIGYVGYWRPLRLELDMRLYRDHIDDFIGQVGAAPDTGSFGPKVFTFSNMAASIPKAVRFNCAGGRARRWSWVRIMRGCFRARIPRIRTSNGIFLCPPLATAGECSPPTGWAMAGCPVCLPGAVMPRNG